jgi:uncharacterized membrane protein
MTAAYDPDRPSRPWLQRLFLWTAVVILAPASLALAATLLLGLPLPWQFHVPWVSPHIVAALLALALGILQLGLRKGDRRHRLVGYAWCALIAFICLSGLGIRLEPGHVTIVHKISSVFAVGDLFLVPVVIFAGRTGRRRLHRFAVLAIFAFMLNAGLLAFIPFRALGGLVIGLFH